MKKIAMTCVKRGGLPPCPRRRRRRTHDQRRQSRSLLGGGTRRILRKPARIIEVEMSEMDFTPSRIEVKRGEQIRFVIRNVPERKITSSCWRPRRKT